MCTVTFIPFHNSFFITSNRDESPGRKAKELTSLHLTGDTIIHFPLDDESGGSWIAMSEKGRAVCLLNGAFEAFVPEPSYRISRGKVVVHAALDPDITAFIKNYELNGIAPFTLLIFEKEKFVQLIWDGTHRHINDLAADKPEIWSSVTLYPFEVREKRRKLFESWLQQTATFDREAIMKFHQFTQDDPRNDFIMNRNDIVRTLSITSIELTDSKASLLHLDLDTEIRQEVLVSYE
jgi:hypothetical protein